MSVNDSKAIEQKVVALRRTHDELQHLIESDPKAALRVLDKARNELFELVEAYERMGRNG